MEGQMQECSGTAHPVGMKHDDGKVMAGLMVEDFAAALKSVAEVTSYGAAKYGPNNWRQVPDAERRYADALYRHLLDHARGKQHDRESGHLHLAHAAWNVLALLQFELEMDQRVDHVETQLMSVLR